MKNRIARLIFGGLLLLAFFSTSWAVSYGPYALTAPMAVDGDTVRADVAIWPDLVADTSIRVAGVDTPELHPVCPASMSASDCANLKTCEKPLAEKARSFVDAWILNHQPLTIANVKPDKFRGRVDAEVIGKDGTLLAGALIAAGMGRPYNGGTRQPWCP